MLPRTPPMIPPRNAPRTPPTTRTNRAMRATMRRKRNTNQMTIGVLRAVLGKPSSLLHEPQLPFRNNRPWPGTPDLFEEAGCLAVGPVRATLGHCQTEPANGLAAPPPYRLRPLLELPLPLGPIAGQHCSPAGGVLADAWDVLREGRQADLAAGTVPARLVFDASRGRDDEATTGPLTSRA